MPSINWSNWEWVCKPVSKLHPCYISVEDGDVRWNSTVSISLSFSFFSSLSFLRSDLSQTLSTPTETYSDSSSHISMHEVKLLQLCATPLSFPPSPLLSFCATGPWWPNRESSAEYETTPVAADATVCVSFRKRESRWWLKRSYFESFFPLFSSLWRWFWSDDAS